MSERPLLDVEALSEPELIALRDLLGQLIPVATVAERAGRGADISLSLNRGTASAMIVFSAEVRSDA